MSWEGKPMPVAGAGGFFGSHRVGRLALMGAKVRALIRYTSRSYELPVATVWPFNANGPASRPGPQLTKGVGK